MDDRQTAGQSDERIVGEALSGGFEKLVVDGSEQVVWWREQAVNACAHALSAYEEVRGDGPTVAPQEDE